MTIGDGTKPPKRRQFAQERHRVSRPLINSRPVVVLCEPMRSGVNLAQIARISASSAVDRMIVCEETRLDPSVSRISSSQLHVERHRTPGPVIQRLKSNGYRIVAIEQATFSVPLPAYRFDRRSVLVLGNERLGVTDESLALADDVVEIPLNSRPFSMNVGMAACVALYEYCRQFPDG